MVKDGLDAIVFEGELVHKKLVAWENFKDSLYRLRTYAGSLNINSSTLGGVKSCGFQDGLETTSRILFQYGIIPETVFDSTRMYLKDNNYSIKAKKIKHRKLKNIDETTTRIDKERIKSARNFTKEELSNSYNTYFYEGVCAVVNSAKSQTTVSPAELSDLHSLDEFFASKEEKLLSRYTK